MHSADNTNIIMAVTTNFEDANDALLRTKIRIAAAVHNHCNAEESAAILRPIRNI